jgi:hypothetical protein
MQPSFTTLEYLLMVNEQEHVIQTKIKFQDFLAVHQTSQQVSKSDAPLHSLLDTDGGPIQQYVSAVGIASIASQPILDHVLITPYGTFPIALVNLSVSLVWYHNMLVGSKMQG